MLSDDVFIKNDSLLQYAEDLISWFVSTSRKVFGDIFVIYNVHSLLHVVDDVRFFKVSLNSLSAFKFENHMQVFKSAVRNGNNILAQIYKRDVEVQQNNLTETTSNEFTRIIDGKSKNSCFYLANGDLCFVKSVVDDNVAVSFVRKYSLTKLYTFPMDSTNIGISYIENFAKVKKREVTIPKIDLCTKNVCLPYKMGFACFPLVHELHHIIK